MKKLLLGAAIVAAVLSLAAPAMAWTHMIEVAGSADCQQPPGYPQPIVRITWVVTNTVEGNVQLTDSSRPTVVHPDALFGGNMSVDFAEVIPYGTTGDQTLTLSWLDANEATQSSSATVSIKGICQATSPPPTSPPPTSPPPTTPPPTTVPPTNPPPTTFTPPARLAVTGGSLAAPVIAFGGLLAIGLGLLFWTRKQADDA